MKTREELYEEYKRSGQTVASFSREQGIPAQIIYDVTQRERRRELRQREERRFIPVGTPPPVTIKITTADSLTIETPLNFLKEVLTIVGVKR